jgi:hypothetical protein
LKKVICFETRSAPSLTIGLLSGLLAYTVDLPKFGSSTTLWLQLRDGRTVRVRPEMHNLKEWEEIGTLSFEVVGPADSPEMIALPAVWSEIRAIEKLVYHSVECSADCGLILYTMSGDSLIVLPGADVYTLAIQAPFFQLQFSPENNLTSYAHQNF